ncbi:hypothetical protein [Jiella sp. M17.18]|uniref:hypothetical protein n=1 Tax=Jiella sp. M17.18 TaxID=3234247 RepID=UPI0034DE353A
MKQEQPATAAGRASSIRRSRRSATETFGGLASAVGRGARLLAAMLAVEMIFVSDALGSIVG